MPIRKASIVSESPSIQCQNSDTSTPERCNATAGNTNRAPHHGLRNRNRKSKAKRELFGNDPPSECQVLDFDVSDDVDSKCTTASVLAMLDGASKLMQSVHDKKTSLNAVKSMIQAAAAESDISVVKHGLRESGLLNWLISQTKLQNGTVPDIGCESVATQATEIIQSITGELDGDHWIKEAFVDAELIPAMAEIVERFAVYAATDGYLADKDSADEEELFALAFRAIPTLMNLAIGVSSTKVSLTYFTLSKKHK